MVTFQNLSIRYFGVMMLVLSHLSSAMLDQLPTISNQQNSDNSIIVKPFTKSHLRVESIPSHGPTSAPTSKVNPMSTTGPTKFPKTVHIPTISTNSTSASSSDMQASLISTRGIAVIAVCVLLLCLLITGLVVIYNRDMWSNTVKRGIRRVSQHLERTRKSVKGFLSGLYTSSIAAAAAASPPKRGSVEMKGSVEKRGSSTEKRGSVNSPEKRGSTEIVWTQTKLSTGAKPESKHGTMLLSHFGPNDASALNRHAARRSSVRQSQQLTKIVSMDNQAAAKPVAEEVPTEII